MKLRRTAATALAALTAVAAGASATIAAGGCGSTYHPDDPGVDASQAMPMDRAATDAPAVLDAPTCTADVMTDPHHCGRCGHDCLGGSCTGGLCEPIEIATTGGTLRHVLLSGSNLFVSSFEGITGAVWRVPTNGGAAERFVASLPVQEMGVLGDTLYFMVYDAAADGAAARGGLYSCPALGAAPCAPTLVAPSNLASALYVADGRVFYTDTTVGKGLMVYAPPSAPTVYETTSTAIGNADDIYVDGPLVFYSLSNGNGQFQAADFSVARPDGGAALLFEYEKPNALTGGLRGSPTALYMAAFEEKLTSGGIVHRILRDGGVACDLGGTSNVRPRGIHVDDAHVFWANQGVGLDRPYTSSSIAACPVEGCCTTPAILWTGDGEAVDVTGDASALYFIGAANGSVWKLAKP